MSQPKLYRNLSRLAPALLDQFDLFIHSPLHNTHKETTALWLALRPHHPDFNCLDQELFAAAFPAKPYDNARLRVLRAYLLDHLEEFLIWHTLKSDTPMRNRLLRRALDEHAIDSMRKSAFESVSGPTFWDPELAIEEFLLAQELLKKAVQNNNRGMVHDLSSVMAPLDGHYIITKLKYLCAMADPITREKPLVADSGLEHLIGLYHSLGMSAQPLAAIYFHLLHMLMDREAELHSQNLQQLLRQSHPFLDAHERLNLYTYWLNYLNRKLREGKEDAITQMFSVYKDMVEMEVLFMKAGQFAAMHFRNIVITASMLGEFAWAEKFLEEQAPRLQLPWRVGVHAFCAAYLASAQGRQSDALKRLKAMEYYDAEIRISTQLLLIRIHFETNDIIGIESVRDALKIFLYRNKGVSLNTKEASRNFARFAVRIFHLQGLKSPQAAAQKLLAEMQSCPQLRERNWLYGKLRQLEMR